MSQTCTASGWRAAAARSQNLSQSCEDEGTLSGQTSTEGTVCLARASSSASNPSRACQEPAGTRAGQF